MRFSLKPLAQWASLLERTPHESSAKRLLQVIALGMTLSISARWLWCWCHYGGDRLNQVGLGNSADNALANLPTLEQE